MSVDPLRVELSYLKRGLLNEPLHYLHCTAFRMASRKIRHIIQFTSIGGVGTTFLYDFARKAGLDIYSPYDGGPWRFDYGRYKHMRQPPCHSMVRAGYRVVYIIGDPRNAVVSLFRRGFNTSAQQRLETPAETRAAFDTSWTLDEYLAQRKDLYLLEAHVRNWVTATDVGYPIAVVRYERLHEVRHDLLDFLGLKRSEAANFPRINPRKSDYRDLSAPAIAAINDTYGQLARRVDDLPAFRINGSAPQAVSW